MLATWPTASSPKRRSVVGLLLVEAGGRYGADMGGAAAGKSEQPVERVNARGEQHAAAGRRIEVPIAAVAFHPKLDHAARAMTHGPQPALVDQLPCRKIRQGKAHGVAACRRRRAARLVVHRGAVKRCGKGGADDLCQVNAGLSSQRH
jgi:hypothetical protein